MSTSAIDERLAEFAFKKIKNQLTHEDEQELADIFEKSPEKKALFEELIDPAYLGGELKLIDELDVDAVWKEYEQEDAAAVPQHKPGADI